MELSVTAAKAQLMELVRRAEAGEEIVLTRRGRAAARIVSVPSHATKSERATRLDQLLGAGLRESGQAELPSAARSQDFLYGDDGLPK
ncbi:type II toxin-antitoxin system prevent-host-death family antitoxin [Jiella endophytica]|uniref:Antitoxin n=1 Tax=Jiella endophytica TaxID=2558362 RepID=A0A4Y8RPC8_9HYPH|nr:type II toxin-antitoxin system prevent-host-death family antitoxin [Jiella endophytica]TFF25439.1 type II toxin-antitoxin system prevent-host-death family antitoxin [Jiella endophytica]